MQEKKPTKKLREREPFFVRENYAQKYRIEKIMKKNYNKRIRIRNKINEDKGKDEA